jgi:hypothetical protein
MMTAGGTPDSGCGGQALRNLEGSRRDIATSRLIRPGVRARGLTAAAIRNGELGNIHKILTAYFEIRAVILSQAPHLLGNRRWSATEETLSSISEAELSS